MQLLLRPRDLEPGAPVNEVGKGESLPLDVIAVGTELSLDVVGGGPLLEGAGWPGADVLSQEADVLECPLAGVGG